MSSQPGCALFYPEEDGVVIGGKRLGFPSPIRIDFVLIASEYSEPSVGLRIFFLRGHIDAASFHTTSGELARSLVFIIRFRAGTFTVSGESISDEVHARLRGSLPEEGDKKMYLLHLKLNEGEKSTVEGLGFPFVGETQQISNYVNVGTKIEGVRTLREMISQTEFHILLPNNGLEKKVDRQFAIDMAKGKSPIYPYGTEYVAFYYNFLRSVFICFSPSLTLVYHNSDQLALILRRIENNTNMDTGTTGIWIDGGSRPKR